MFMRRFAINTDAVTDAVIQDFYLILFKKYITSFSTRPRFQCGIVQFTDLVKKVSIACNIVLINKFVKNY